MKLSKSERKAFRHQLGEMFREIHQNKNMDIENGAECQKMSPLRLLELEEHGRRFMNMRLSRLLEMASNYDHDLCIRLVERLKPAAK